MTKAIQGLSLVPRIHSIVVSGVGWPWLVKEMTGTGRTKAGVEMEFKLVTAHVTRSRAAPTLSVTPLLSPSFPFNSPSHSQPTLRPLLNRFSSFRAINFQSLSTGTLTIAFCDVYDSLLTLWSASTGARDSPAGGEVRRY
jgi:hypothetical protein